MAVFCFGGEFKGMKTEGEHGGQIGSSLLQGLFICRLNLSTFAVMVRYVRTENRHINLSNYAQNLPLLSCTSE